MELYNPEREELLKSVKFLRAELDETTKELKATKLALDTILATRSRTAIYTYCPECGRNLTD